MFHLQPYYCSDSTKALKNEPFEGDFRLKIISTRTSGTTNGYPLIDIVMKCIFVQNIKEMLQRYKPYISKLP